MVETLINYGADVNAQDIFDRTPLYLAARQGINLSTSTRKSIGSIYCDGFDRLCNFN